MNNIKIHLSASLIAATILFNACSDDTETIFTYTNTVKVGTYTTNLEGGSEIVAYDKVSQRMFTTNGAENALDIIDISDVTNPTLISSISLAEYGTGVNSVATHNGLVAVAVQNGDDIVGQKQLKGNIVFFDTNGEHTKTVEAGYLPDMVIFNEDGTKVIVANEGEPNGDYSVDPIGSIGVIDVSNYIYTDIKLDIVPTNATDGTEVRLGKTPSDNQQQDLEPEYVTVNANYAYVTLQENNAVAKVDLTTNSLEYIKSLGAKSWEADSGNTLDIEEEGIINMKSYKGLFGLYQPDSIDSYTSAGVTYLVTANEGDGREYIYEDENGVEQESLNDESKISKLDLDDSIASEYINENDLKVMVDLGDENGDGKYEKLYTYGARSFSIWNENGDIVFDSGDAISKKVAELQPALFNQDDGVMDGRSGNKASEPEALEIGTIADKTFAFIGLERQSVIIIYILQIQKLHFMLII